ncbi:hypothetical protein INTERNEXUS_160 [Bacillus phage vB_BspM_Internexus]|nr:hypothetical protein INTERNEXUS_160 [Bacillus phage vB_BspM_Internexus]
MPNEMRIESNDVQNGYIYKELNNRLSYMEKNMEQLFNLLSVINSSGIELSQLTNLIKDIQSKANIEYVKNHVEDSKRHLNDIKVLDWDSKYSKPINGIPESDLDGDVRRKLNDIRESEDGSLIGVLKYSELIGNSSNHSFVIRHNLGTNDINVSVWDEETKDLVMTNVSIEDANTIRINFLSAPSSNQYKVIVIG